MLVVVLEFANLLWRHHRGLWCDPPGVGGVSMSDQVGHAGHRSRTHRLELLCVLVDGQRSLLVLWHGATVRHHSHHHRPHHVVGLRSAWVLFHMAGSCSKVIVTRYRLCTNIVCVKFRMNKNLKYYEFAFLAFDSGYFVINA